MTDAQRGFLHAVSYLDLLDYWTDEPSLTIWLKDGTEIEVDEQGFADTEAAA
jgi:hypothetical protein